VCDAIAVGLAAYSAVRGVNDVAHGRYGAAAWDAADVVTLGYGRRAKTAAEGLERGVSAMSRKSARLARRGKSYQHAGALESDSMQLANTRFRGEVAWHVGYGLGLHSVHGDLG
jgi:hypothetical protein